jgi:hypothetical protein
MSDRFNHIVVSLLLLVGTTGLTLSAHCCAGELYSFRLFGYTSDCYTDSDCGTCSDNIFKLGLSDEYIIRDSQTSSFSSTFVKVLFGNSWNGSNSYHLSNNRPFLIRLKTQPMGLKQSLSMMQSFLL